MKYFHQGNFKESICFTPEREIHENPIIVHVHEAKPVDYAIPSIIEAWVRKEKIMISFAKMSHRKMKAQETGTSFPLSAENLPEDLDKYHPVKEIYNAISLSGDPLIS